MPQGATPGIRRENAGQLGTRTLLLTFMLVVALAGCDAFDDMSKMFEKQSKAQQYVKDKYGLNASLGFNIHNGELTNVTVAFAYPEVRSKAVSELEAIARETAKANFASEPQQIVVQVITSPADG